MTVEPTDTLAVARESTLYSVQVENLMANVQDTDLLVLSRNDIAYKVTGAELKGSVEPAVAPVINTVALTESNPDVGPRFTEQTFNVSVDMTANGYPVSEKAIDAYVKGSLTIQYVSDPITALNVLSVSNTIVTVSGEKDLDKLTVGTTVNNGKLVSDPDYNEGVVNSVTIDGANSQINLETTEDGWAIGEVVQTAAEVVNNTVMYLDFDSDGNVLTLSDTKPSPGYVTTDNPANLVLTFPATFPSGEVPDTEFPEGTTLTVDVTASNSSGTDTKSTTILPIIVPNIPQQPKGSGVFITTMSGATTNVTISSEITSPVIVGPWGINGSNGYAVTEDGNLIEITTDGTQTVKGPGYGTAIVEERIASGAGMYDGQHIVLTDLGNLYYYNGDNFTCTTAASPNASLVGEAISNLTCFSNYSSFSLAWSNENQKLWGMSGNATAIISGITANTMSGFGAWDLQPNLFGITFDLNPGVNIRQIVSGSFGSGTLSNTFTNLLVLFEDGKLFWTNPSGTSSEVDAGEGKTWKQIASTYTISGDPVLTILDSTNVCSIFNGTTGAIDYVMPGTWIYCPLGETQATATPVRVVGYNSLGECFMGGSDQTLSTQSLPTINTVFDYKGLDGFLMNQAKFAKTFIYFPSFPESVSLMSAEEYTETALKFSTYENREMVRCGIEAQDRRDQLILALRAQGFELEDILQYL
tara:strand:+ start:131 stop:2224 length:2094 start_codon:yes stop_codon:yes gene_type:complete